MSDADQLMEIKKDDDLATDLVRILAKKAGDGEGTIYASDIKNLIADLSIFIVNRDHKIFNHAYNLGKESK